MLSEDLRLLSGWELLYLSQVILGLGLVVLLLWRLLFRNDVLGRVRIANAMLVFRDYCLIEVLCCIYVEQSSIPIVGDSSSVGDL
jgi:hypothetical protein